MTVKSGYPAMGVAWEQYPGHLLFCKSNVKKISIFCKIKFLQPGASMGFDALYYFKRTEDKEEYAKGKGQSRR